MILKIIRNGQPVVTWSGALIKAVAAAAVLVGATAWATPRPLPFTYGTDSLASGNLEVEQFVDMTPVRVEQGFAPDVTLITEVEVGITDKLELGLYYQALAGPDDGMVVFDGIKQRLRYRLAEPGEWPIDVALYGEVAEMHDEIELEAKILLQRRFGAARVMVNLWGEREFAYTGGGAWVLNPTAGFVYEIRPWLIIGLEGWLRGEVGTDHPGFNEQFHAFVGPTVMVSVGRLWWSVAPYVRLDGLDRGAQRGDEFGRVWIRSVVGLEL